MKVLVKSAWGSDDPTKAAFPFLHARATLAIEGRSAVEVFGSPDDMKLRSSATLFASVSPPGSVFGQLLDRYFGGEPDDQTLRLLRGQSA